MGLGTALLFVMTGFGLSLSTTIRLDVALSYLRFFDLGLMLVMGLRSGRAGWLQVDATRIARAPVGRAVSATPHCLESGNGLGSSSP